MIERKSFPITDLKADDKDGTICAIVSVFNNLDSGNEIVRPGFFKDSIARKLPKGVWAHDWKQPIAKTLEAKEILAGDPSLPEHLAKLGGTYIKGQFNLDTQRGREAYSDIKFGIVDEFSIGYMVTKDTMDQKTGIRELLEGDWAEWSPVLKGMNDQTTLISIKDAESESLDSFEKAVSAIEKHTQKMRGNHDNRTKEGRVLSSSNRQKVAACKESLAALIADLEDLLLLSEPKPKEKEINVMALRTQSDRIRNDLIRLMQ